MTLTTVAEFLRNVREAFGPDDPVNVGALWTNGAPEVPPLGMRDRTWRSPRRAVKRAMNRYRDQRYWQRRGE